MSNILQNQNKPQNCSIYISNTVIEMSDEIKQKEEIEYQKFLKNRQQLKKEKAGKQSIWNFRNIIEVIIVILLLVALTFTFYLYNEAKNTQQNKINEISTISNKNQVRNLGEEQLSLQLTELQVRLSKIEDQNLLIESKLNNLTSKLNDFDTKLEDLVSTQKQQDKKIVDLIDNIQNLESNQIQNDSKIEIIFQEKLDDLKRMFDESINNLGSEVSKVYFSRSEQELKLTQLEQNQESFNQQYLSFNVQTQFSLTSINDEIIELKSKSSSNQVESSVDNDISQLNNKVSRMENLTRILNSTVGDLKRDSQALQTKVDGKFTSICSSISELKDLHEPVEYLQHIYDTLFRLDEKVIFSEQRLNEVDEKNFKYFDEKINDYQLRLEQIESTLKK